MTISDAMVEKALDEWRKTEIRSDVSPFEAMLAALTAALSLPEQEGWQTMDTMKEKAPKWGEHFLIYRVGERINYGPNSISRIVPNQIGLARYKPDDQIGWRMEKDWNFLGEPTHWMPLPSPPKTGEPG